MTKWNQFTDPLQQQGKIDWINRVWTNWSDSRMGALRRATSYLFILNSGGLLSVVAYIAAISTSDKLERPVFSLWCFSVGTVLSIAHAALDYYCIEHDFKMYKKNVNEMYDNKLDWEVLVDRTTARGISDFILHIVGWLGLVAFVLGLIKGISIFY